MEKEELIRKGNKILLITACVIIPALVFWLFFGILSETRETQQVQEPQYQDFDSTVWIPQKVKYKTTEKYETYTKYILSFYDGSEITVNVGDYNDLKEGDSTCYGETQTFRRRIN